MSETVHFPPRIEPDLTQRLLERERDRQWSEVAVAAMRDSIEISITLSTVAARLERVADRMERAPRRRGYDTSRRPPGWGSF